MKQCSWCTGDVQDTDRTCSHCGMSVDAPVTDTWGEDEIVRHAGLPTPAAAPVVPSAPPAVAPVPPPAPAPSRGLNRAELLIVLLSIAAGGAITMGVLMARGAKPQAAVHVAAGGIAPAVPAVSPAAAIAPSAPRWTDANRARWVRNPRREVAFELPAENKVQAWTTQVEPVLVVRCMARRVEAFVYTATPARIEPQDEDHTVAIAFDDEPQSAERWPDSAEHDALFAPDGEAFARRIAGARTLRFGFTPHNARPVTVHFNVEGLRGLLEPAARQCGWKK